MSESGFRFLDPGGLVDDDLELVLVERAPADPAKGYVPAYKFEMRRVGGGAKVGTVEFRAGDTPDLVTYGGHFGYAVDAAYRGHRYAARSLRLLFPLARRHLANPCWVTCDPDNVASRRTCEIAGGTLVEIVDLPEDNEQVARGHRQKCRYRFLP